MVCWKMLKKSITNHITARAEPNIVLSFVKSVSGKNVELYSSPFPRSLEFQLVFSGVH